MTNRERYILQANEYDLLIKLQEGLNRSDSYCILDLITDKYNCCPKDTDCKNCIQNWLNTEEIIMNYDKIFEKMVDGESITNEEWDFILRKVQEKLERKEVISAQEITEVVLECAELDYAYGEPTRHGWIDTKIIFTFDNENYYSFDCWWHDDQGIDGVDDQVCPRMIKKPVMVEKWIEAEEDNES